MGAYFKAPPPPTKPKWATFPRCRVKRGRGGKSAAAGAKKAALRS